MGVGGQGNVATPSFGGTQSYLNNAIGANNYLLTGGAAQLAGPSGQNNLQPVSVPGIPSPWGGGGSGGTMQPAPGGGGGGSPPSFNVGGMSAGGLPGPPSGGGAGNPAGGNPYLAAYYNAASLPMVQNFQNAVAPNILANAAGTGTVGGSGQQQAFANAESGLAQGLGTLGANIYEPAWAQTQQISANEAMQQQALQAQAAMQSQGLGAQELMQQRGLASGLFENAMNEAPALTSAAYIPSQMMAQSGAGAQNQLQNILNTAYGNLFSQQQYPFQALGQLGQGLGAAQGNAGQQVSVGSGMGGMK